MREVTVEESEREKLREGQTDRERKSYSVYPAMDLEGIFRISGLASDIDKLVKQFEAAGMF